MKNYILLVLSLLASTLFAQPEKIVFGYDDRGNRISASIIVMLVEENDPIEKAVVLDSEFDVLAKDINTEEEMAVENELSSDMFHLYPNPTQDYVNIRSTSFIGALDIDILDSSGKKLDSRSLKGENKIEMKEYASGSYFIVIRSQTDRLVYKVIKN